MPKARVSKQRIPEVEWNFDEGPGISNTPDIYIEVSRPFLTIDALRIR
jgi:hypothetical protein